MDIRSKVVGDKYREAKKFVEEYERQHWKESCTWTPSELELHYAKIELQNNIELSKEFPRIGKGKAERSRKRLHKLLKKKHVR